MATLQKLTQKQVLDDPRSRDVNVPNSNRTFYEMLSDPDVGDVIKNDVVNSFTSTYVKPPATTGQSLTSSPSTGPAAAPPVGAPAGGLQPGETVAPDGTISYSPLLEESQSQKFTVNIGSLVGGKMTAEGSFLPGPPRPGSPSFTFNLRPGQRPEDITADDWDAMLRVVQARDNAGYQAAKEYQGIVKTIGKTVGREGLLAVPSILDMPSLAARAVDYVFSPVGTNTLSQDIYQPIRKGLGLSDTRPRSSSPYLEDVPRIGQQLGLYSTEYPNALYQGAVTIRPDQEIMPIHSGLGKLLDEVLINVGAPGLLTPQQETDAQRMAVYWSSLFAGSITTSGATRLAAKAVTKGLTVEKLQDATTLNKFLYSVANSPGATFAVGKKTRRRFNLPGTMLFMAKDLGTTGVAGTAMYMTPDEWGPTGKIMAGLTAPFALSKAMKTVTSATKGQGLPIIGGFLEPFSQSGQQRLAARYVANIPGIAGNEPLVVRLLSDLEDVPTRPGQDALVSTPAYFNKVSDDLRQAKLAWTELRENGVSDTAAVAQLSQNAVYGKYMTGEVPVFGNRAPSIESLAEVETSLKLVSDSMFGAMSWLSTGSPIKNEVLRAAGNRLRTSESVFKDLSRNFDGDPNAASSYVEKSVQRLNELTNDALATHATDALLYNQLVERLGNDTSALSRSQISTAERGVEGVQNAFKEAREIERALYTNIGANEINISAENMALIGDKAAEIILSTPVAQRNQVPPILYQIAGKSRLLSEDALESMARAAGASTDTPSQIITARARLAQLEGELNAIPAGQTIEDPKVVSRLNKKREQIEGQVSKLNSLEENLVPTVAAGDEAITMGPNGILDGVNTLDEVFAARSALLDAAARARARTGGKNSARIANNAQSYIIEDWLQNPEIFGDVGTTSAYDAARRFSSDLNNKFTRGPISEYLAVSANRSDKVDHNQFLAKLIKDNQTGPGKVPSGSLDEFDASLVEAKAPFLIRSDDGTISVDPNAALTPGLEGLTWESIRTAGPGSEKLSSQLLREEVLNQLALIAFDSTGTLNPQKVQKAVRSWALPIQKIEESYPGFGKEIQELATVGEKLALRKKMLENPSKKTIDEALATQNLDDIAGIQEAGIITRKLQADRSSASIFLDNDPDVVALKLLNDPALFETNVATTLKILDADDTGAARAGFQRSIFNELLRKTLAQPESAGRMAGETVLDPAQINQVLTQNETALRQVFSDVIKKGPDGKDITSYDILKTFNDEMSLGMSERAGRSAGAVQESIELTLRGSEMVRNLGRIAGVQAAKLTGGPALVMAGTGGRLAGKIYESGGQDAIFKLVSDALSDPSLAKILLTETASLSKAGKFVFDKRLTQAVLPYQFMAGPPAVVVREGMKEQNEIERVEREGGPQELRYDPDLEMYVREKVGPQSSLQPAAQPARQMAAAMPPPRAPRADSTLGQVNPMSFVGQPPSAPAPAPAPAQAQQETLARLDQLNMPLFAKHGGYIEKSGIMSVKPKARQLVG